MFFENCFSSDSTAVAFFPLKRRPVCCSTWMKQRSILLSSSAEKVCHPGCVYRESGWTSVTLSGFPGTVKLLFLNTNNCKLILLSLFSFSAAQAQLEGWHCPPKEILLRRTRLLADVSWLPLSHGRLVTEQFYTKQTPAKCTVMPKDTQNSIILEIRCPAPFINFAVKTHRES